MKIFLKIILLAVVFTTSIAQALTIPIYLTDDMGRHKKIGTVKADDTIYGVLFQPNLNNLPAGMHGFHVHELPMCQHEGMTAGGHLDPTRTETHLGPYGSGHLGDLPALYVDKRGRASMPVLAPRLKLAFIVGRALMVHMGGDSYSDTPVLGGGGVRIACGVIPYH